MPNAVIAHAPDGKFDLAALKREAAAWPGMIGLDLAKDVTCGQSYSSDETEWRWGEGYGRQEAPRFHVVAIDYGLKRNILRELATAGCRLTVVPATATAEEILERKPDGVFLSNGPGDPAATGVYAVPEIKKLVESGLPVFGICLGHQMLGLALGGTTAKMHQGHHGANHPVKDFTTHKVEITSMNHGFAVDRASLPAKVEETHVSLFDGSNCGLKLKDKPVFSVQYHPEASPGPARQPLSLHPLRRADGEAEGRSVRLSHAQAHRHKVHPDHRGWADRHRPGLRVRLFRHASLQGLERRGLSHRAGELEPGHDHDRSGIGRRHLYRADHARIPHQDHRAGAARRAAADHGRARPRSTPRSASTAPACSRNSAWR